jgi:3-methyladenine DNA glycosylase AlkD
MNRSELLEDIRKFCAENQNAENALKAKRYFKESPDCYGLTQPQMNEKAKQLLREKAVTLPTVLEAIPALFKSAKYEEVTIGLLLVNGFEKQYSKELFSEIGTWFSYSIYNWAHADTLGMFILPKFFKYKIIEERDFKSWLKSKYKFQRRCVPVTLIKTLKTRDNFQQMFKFLEQLMADPEREVHQGMGWFLRECWKIKPNETEEFLLKWKDKAPRLIIQYATEKMAKEEKDRFRREK